MRNLIVVLFVSLAIRLSASDTYIYPPGLDSAIQHWQYPNTAAMTADFGFYSQDIGKIAFNKGDGIYYYLADTLPTWTPMATGGGGGSTTFIGLVDTPNNYTGAAGKLVAVNGTADGLIFQTAAGGGNVSNTGTPATDETAVWTDSTHVKGVRTLGGGSNTFVLTKLSNTDYDYGWVAATGGSTVSITATSPIVVTPSPLTGTGTISLDGTSDLAALEALTGTNTIYYRSAASTWSPVVIGSNLTFSGGTLAASTGGSGTNAFGTVSVSGQTDVVADAAPDTLTLVAGSNITITTNALTDTITINGVGSGITSVSATSPIQVTPNPITTTGTVSLESGSDLAALEALTGTNTIYYRSGVSTWSSVTIGSNMTFTAGSLAAGNANWDTGYNERRQWDGGATNLNATLGRSNLGATTIGANVFTLTNPLATSWLKVSSAGATTLEDAATTKTSLGLNTANWDTAYTDRMKWDTSLGISGGTTGQGRTALGATTAGSNLFTLANPASTSWMKVGATGVITLEDAATTKTSLSLNNVTNDAQTQSAVMPNTLPASGQIPVGNAGGTAYVPRTVSGDITLSNTGVATLTALTNVTNDAQTKAAIVPNTAPAAGQILVGNVGGTAYVPRTMTGGTLSATGALSSIPNASLSNSSITIAGNSTALGGSVSLDTITGVAANGYIKRTAANTLTNTATIPNGDLANSAITITGNSTALGGSIGLDAITGVTTNGLIKRTGLNTLATAVADTDYKAAGTAAVVVKLITTTSTYTTPAGVNALYVEGVGGGGGGGGIHQTGSAASCAACGGGGGGYAATYIAAPAASYSVTIGAAGTAGPSGTSGNDGGNGGNTTFGVVLTATGGSAGTGANTLGNPSALVWCQGGVGGAGTVGTLQMGGSDGGAALTVNATSAMGGTGGSSYLGGGTKGAYTLSAGGQGGNTGAKYGGGGSGAATSSITNQTGGAGAAGVVRVWEIY